MPPIEDDLMRPDAYPEPPGTIELLQTHISYVFITDEYVYKVKKPMDFGFLDFSTLEKRKHYCEQEVKLNRRLAPDTYLGVVPLTEKEGRLVLGGSGPAVEYAVRMRRIPMDRLMKTLLAEGELEDQHLLSVGRTIAQFHHEAERSADIDKFGTAEGFKVNTDENFEQTEPFIGRTIDRETFDALKGWTNAFFSDKAAVFARRVEEGRVRDCHGDLHMEHVVLTDPVVIFDCIEFNDRFRYCDTAADIAFLSMDLDFHGRRDLTEALMKAYVGESGDTSVHDVLDFYKVYRAYVRGKVIGFRLDDPHISGADKEEATTTARKYFDLAKSYIS